MAKQRKASKKLISTTNMEKSILCFLIDLSTFKIEASTKQSKKINKTNKE